MLRYSWNAISFAEVDLYEAGTTNLIAQLTPADAVNHGATPNGEGKWVPEGFNSVNLGTNGSASFNIDIPEAGQYLTRVFYQNPGAAQTGNISLDGAEVSSFAFDSKADSTGENGVSDLFTVASAGTHAVKITGSGANVDKLQLIQRTFTGVNDRNNLPNQFSLSQNYPNPFNPTTTINFNLAKSSNVNLYIYNILGQRVAHLVNGFMDAGKHSIKFNASNFASGVYIYRIEAGNFKANRKMVLLK